MTAVLIGIDIGGTAIKIGLTRLDGHIISKTQLAFDRTLAFEDLTDRVATVCHRLSRQVGGEIEAVGVCLPGFVDPETGVLCNGGANVPCLIGRPVKASLEMKLARPVWVTNDGVAATVGEKSFGAGQTFQRIVLLTLGTGVGGAVALGEEVITGPKGEPPELGAIVLCASGQRTKDPQPRTLEDFASVRGFLQAYKDCGGSSQVSNVEELFARCGSEVQAATAVDRVCARIAQALGTLVNSLHLDACLIGGGISAAGEPLIQGIRSHLPEYTWPLLMQRVCVLPTSSSNDAGLLGAAKLAHDRILSCSNAVPNFRIKP
jgi:glucokinase